MKNCLERKKAMEIDKIICGDAYELIKSIPDKSIDCIITDPPYEYDEKIKWFQSGIIEETKASFGGIDGKKVGDVNTIKITYEDGTKTFLEENGYFDALGFGKTIVMELVLNRDSTVRMVSVYDKDKNVIKRWTKETIKKD